MSSNEPNQKPEEQPTKDKFKETLENLKKPESYENLVSFAKSNTQDTIAFVLMVIGIMWIFLSGGIYAGILVGLVAGFYFADEIILNVRSLNETIQKVGMTHALILGGMFVALFIAAPGIFIGAAVAAGLKQIIKG